MTSLSFSVIGLPAPQGSKRHVGHGVMIESSTAVRPWRAAIVYAAREAMERAGLAAPVFDCPVKIDIEFRLPRPKSAPRRRPSLPCRKPDLDKLLRAAFDALTTASVLADDARVTTIRARKMYPYPPFDVPGMSIIVRNEDAND